LRVRGGDFENRNDWGAVEVVAKRQIDSSRQYAEIWYGKFEIEPLG